MPLLDVQSLTKRYGARRGIHDVSFTVEEGEVYGFLGPNGAGKTTTIRQVMGFLRPDSGRALVAGYDCWLEPVAVKRVVGYLPTDLALDPGLTGGQLLEYFANLRGGVDPRFIATLAQRAGNQELKPEELVGGTFTITNGGVFGSLLSTPILNPPQSGILGLHAIQDRPVVRAGNVAVRPMMYVALTYDHRLVDGREAVLFLRRVKEAIENPARMLMEV